MFAFAMEERLVCKALLDRLAIISKPGDGGPKILLIFARRLGVFIGGRLTDGSGAAKKSHACSADKASPL